MNEIYVKLKHQIEAIQNEVDWWNARDALYEELKCDSIHPKYWDELEVLLIFKTNEGEKCPTNK